MDKNLNHQPQNKKNIVVYSLCNGSSENDRYLLDLMTQEEFEDSIIHTEFSHATFIKDISNLTNDSVISLSDCNDFSDKQITAWLDSKHKQEKRVAIIQFTSIQQKQNTAVFQSLLSKPRDLIQIGVNPSCTAIHDDIQTVCKNLCQYIDSEKIQELYIWLDISSLDAEYLMSTPQSSYRALGPHEVCYILTALSCKVKIDAAQVTQLHLMPHFKNDFKLNPQPSTTIVNVRYLVRSLKEAIQRWR